MAQPNGASSLETRKCTPPRQIIMLGSPQRLRDFWPIRVAGSIWRMDLCFPFSKQPLEHINICLFLPPFTCFLELWRFVLGV